MTNQASELFELCKEVYEKTGWDSTEKCYAFIDEFGDGGKHWRVIPLHEDNVDDVDDWHPLYTSDYLLEKLLKTLERPNDAYGALWGKPNLTLLDDGLWEASYRYEDEMNHPDFCYVNEHLTPLKALLKLTIALSEAGELK